MKLICLLILSCLMLEGSSQALEIRAGHSLTSADYLSLRYEYYSNTSFNFSGKVFLEGSTKSELNYSAFGIDLMAEYYSNIGFNTDHKWELKAGLGGTLQIENEPWIYHGWSSGRRMNYGLVGELAIEWAMTEEFSLTGFAQQKYLFNKELGHSLFAFGIGIKIKFTE